MGKTLTEKIIESHLVNGSSEKGKEIGLKIDQTLTQDATGTMVYLAFEAMKQEKIRTDLSVSYVDHNLLATDFKNADDHLFLKGIASKYGLPFSPAGNGICHQVHLERFGKPGATLLGSDSHTPTSGALGSLAMGAGGLDVAAAMAGYPFHLTYPKVLGVHLTGSLNDWVSGRDLILKLLGELTVKGGVGFCVEYYGPGVKSVEVTERATVANLGAELGATSSIWPSDEKTKEFLIEQGRGEDYQPLSADDDAKYDQVVRIDLSELEPMIALPSMPDKVKTVKEVAGKVLSQVIIGSCANSSYRDLMTAAMILDSKTVHENSNLEINPGSRRVLEALIKNSGMLKFIEAGARVNQPGCLGCVGVGQAPVSGGVSLRTFTRNFAGRSGTADDQVYLVSPETAAASALNGAITDPRSLGKPISIKPPPPIRDEGDDDPLSPRKPQPDQKIIMGPNIKPFPLLDELMNELTAEVVLKVGDNVTTDQIMPAGSHILPLRSNIPAISQFVFQSLSSNFPEKCETAGQAVVLGGENYGQGSSREHAALAPRFLGVAVKIVKSFARIHKANLINYGILPLTFADPTVYDSLQEGQTIKITGLKEMIAEGVKEIPIQYDGGTFIGLLEISERERRVLNAGGLFNLISSGG